MIKLYQYEVCPYCCKVKAVLDYKKIPYEKIEVNPMTHEELEGVAGAVEYDKVPVLVDGDKVVFEPMTSSNIWTKNTLPSPFSRNPEPTKKSKKSGWNTPTRISCKSSQPTSTERFPKLFILLNILPKSENFLCGNATSSPWAEPLP